MTEARIGKDMTMGEIIQKFPETTSVMLKYGLHCVGCSVAYHETLEQGMKAHGKNEQEVEQLMKDMELAIDDEKDERVIKITESAAKKLQFFAEQEGKKEFGLRVGVIAGGCAGFQYELEIVESPKEGEEVIEEKGVKFFIMPDDVKFVKGTRIDYVDSLQESGFRIINPNATSSCGCGKSFS